MQLIRQLGAIPLETSRSGQPNTININEDLRAQIHTITEGRGVGVVFDMVGEATLFKKALDALGEYGR